MQLNTSYGLQMTFVILRELDTSFLVRVKLKSGLTFKLSFKSFLVFEQPM